MTTMGATEVRRIDPARSGISPWKAFKAKPEDWFDPEEIAKAKRYVTPLRRVNAAKRALTAAIDLVIIGTHAMPNMLHHLGWNSWQLEIVAVTFVTALIALPLGVAFDWWQSMVYDKKWNFSNMTAGTFVGDVGKNLAMELVVGSLMGVGLFWVLRSTDLWWLYGWILFSLFIVGIGLLYPKLIAPMFNKFKTLDDDGLHAELLAVAHSVGADIEKVEVQDASKRDKRDNAYVAGAGKTRRIVLFDTLLTRPPAQIKWISAHEIGHWKLRHILRAVPTAIALLFVNFAVLKVVLSNHRVLQFAGVERIGDPGALPLVFFVLFLPMVVTGLVSAYLSRVAEREADLFGLEAVPDATSAMDAMRQLHTDNLADLAPSLWKRLNHSHPQVAERLAMMQEWERRRNGATPAT